MRVLIVDDEAPARERLRRLLGEIEGVEVVGEAEEGRRALQLAEATGAEVVLLDIRMPGMDGLEAASHLATLREPPSVIFTTAYGEHALAAFEAEAVDYLLKPVRRERLERALEKVRRLTPVQRAALPAGRRTHLGTQHGGSVRLVPVAEILYLRAADKYVTAHTTGGEALLEESLKALEEEFGDLFIRIHRNALVARAALIGIERGAEGTWHARLRGLSDRPEISRRHVSAIRNLLKAVTQQAVL